MEINIRPCKDCLYYEDCIRNAEDMENPVRLKDRIYDIFVEGRDCFWGINRDWD